jgi:hypothetical protein
VPAALVLLMLAKGELWQLVAFTLLLGASQGVITIVRGAVPLALFGTAGYGAVLGVIADPAGQRLFAGAVCPDGRRLRLAGLAVHLAGLRDPDLGRDRTDGALV